ncbi:hypothetical protein JB92DRAFT_2909621, partial [Gautieria morchelliformis]
SLSHTTDVCPWPSSSPRVLATWSAARKSTSIADILQVWFPCIHFGSKQPRSTPSQAESNWALDTEVLAIHSDVAPPE